ncbi:MAG: cell division protein FtsA [Bdellovibrionaceae bacterium]|nr:cell division protein FtsA [Pseudobdellovibrionaceae bacterium]NUM59748.1 cell division protein FtsA [Pseudobdellovibrionaceae bacterium]
MSGLKTKHPVIAGLDIGSTKVCFVIGIVNSENKIEIVGVGKAPNAGIRQGVVVNIEATQNSIKKAKEEAELMSGYQVQDAWVGVSGTHIKSFDSKGMIAIKNKEVSQADIDRVIEAAKAVAVPADRQVLHVLPREFKVDTQDGITDPIGMSGVRLEANVHIVTGGQTAINNTIKCVEKSGIKINSLVLDSLAASTSVISEDEKSLGVCVVDMGGGTCNLLYFVNGSVAHTSVIPVGGQHFTHDVAIGLRTPQVSAEQLKIEHGYAMAAQIGENEVIDVQGVGGRKSRSIPKKDLADVLEARAEETLNLIQHDIKMSGLLPMMGSGVVLTGGASQLQGLIEMGEFIFDIPIRKGVPSGVGGLSDVVKTSEYSTAVGLLKHGFNANKDEYLKQSSTHIITDSADSITKKMKDFFGQIF